MLYSTSFLGLYHPPRPEHLLYSCPFLYTVCNVIDHSDAPRNQMTGSSGKFDVWHLAADTILFGEFHMTHGVWHFMPLLTTIVTLCWLSVKEVVCDMGVYQAMALCGGNLIPWGEGQPLAVPRQPLGTHGQLCVHPLPCHYAISWHSRVSSTLH